MGKHFDTKDITRLYESGLHRSIIRQLIEMTSFNSV